MTVSAASTAPKLSFKPNTLTVNPGANDSATAVATITPEVFANHEIVLESITEGKTTVTNGDVISCSVNGKELTVRAVNYPEDEKAHTYKVNLSVDGSAASVTVNLPLPSEL